MNKVEHLVISNLLDYSTDRVIIEMKRRGLKYLRINRDQFREIRILYSLDSKEMVVIVDNKKYKILFDTLKSVYFRAPVFIRSFKRYNVEEQLERSQWNAFIRNLIIFDKVTWVNNPVSTYSAENKLYQLEMANRVGLVTPKTYVGNDIMDNISSDKLYVVKSLDTALFYTNKYEFFTYTTAILGADLKKTSIKEAPVIIQEYLKDKVDIRVTCVGDKLFPTSITNSGRGIEGDWRKSHKEKLTYKMCNLPNDVCAKLLLLMRNLNLSFGGIDLAFSDGQYYFIEVNPTGEWGWLVNVTGLPITEAIVDFLQ